MKCEMSIFIDLEAEVLDSTGLAEVQKIIKNRIFILLDGKSKMKIKDINAKVLNAYTTE